MVSKGVNDYALGSPLAALGFRLDGRRSVLGEYSLTPDVDEISKVTAGRPRLSPRRTQERL